VPIVIPGDAATDAQLCAELLQHLKIDASSAFVEHAPQQQQAATGAVPSRPSTASHPQVSDPAVHARSNAVPSLCDASRATAPVLTLQGQRDAAGISDGQLPTPSLEQFIASTTPLLELERAAEVATAQASFSQTHTVPTSNPTPGVASSHAHFPDLADNYLQGELAGLSPERAAKRGRTLLNLRCEDVEDGLLGRSLLTLVNNKVGFALMMCRRNVVAEYRAVFRLYE